MRAEQSSSCICLKNLSAGKYFELGITNTTFASRPTLNLGKCKILEHLKEEGGVWIIYTEGVDTTQAQRYGKSGRFLSSDTTGSSNSGTKFVAFDESSAEECKIMSSYFSDVRALRYHEF
jgi:hypothetical protein